MTTDSDDSWQRRRRSWVVAGVLVVAVIATALVAGKHGSSSGGVSRPRVSFGTQVQPPAASGGYLEYTNGWMAVSGNRVIAVSAGSDPVNHRNGLLVIQRGATNTPSGPKRRTLVLHGTGPVTLLRPAAPATEDAAFQTTIHFVTANGGTGTLDLSDDRVSISG